MKKEPSRASPAIRDPEPGPSAAQLLALRNDLESCCPGDALLDDALIEGIFWDLDEGRFVTAHDALRAVLAMRKSLKELTPPYERLLRLAETSPPPPEWFKEDSQGLT